MARPVEIKLEGFKELNQALKQMPEKVALSVIRSSMRKAAQPILQKARELAPDDSGRLRHFLAMGSKKRRDVILIEVGALNMSEKKLAKQGLTSQPYYAKFTEYGTKSQPAQNWLQEAIVETKDAYLDTLRNDLSRRIEREFSKTVK